MARHILEEEEFGLLHFCFAKGIGSEAITFLSTDEAGRAALCLTWQEVPAGEGGREDSAAEAGSGLRALPTPLYFPAGYKQDDKTHQRKEMTH